jgi:hypothetical protein
MPVAWVAAARRSSITPISAATGRAGPRTSTGLPLERCPLARSTTVIRTVRTIASVDRQHHRPTRPGTHRNPEAGDAHSITVNISDRSPVA